jgi:ankyrin repeat protein
LCSDGIVNHLCAISPRDGCTVYHRAVQGSKDVAVLQLLLKTDARRTAINFQDKDGLGPLHVACKLNKHKAVELLCVRLYALLRILCTVFNYMLPVIHLSLAGQAAE